MVVGTAGQGWSPVHAPQADPFEWTRVYPRRGFNLKAGAEIPANKTHSQCLIFLHGIYPNYPLCRGQGLQRKLGGHRPQADNAHVILIAETTSNGFALVNDGISHLCWSFGGWWGFCQRKSNRWGISLGSVSSLVIFWSEGQQHEAYIPTTCVVVEECGINWKRSSPFNRFWKWCW